MLVNLLCECGVKLGDSVVVALLCLVFLILAFYVIVEVGVVWLLLDIGYLDDCLKMMLEDVCLLLLIIIDD